MDMLPELVSCSDSCFDLHQEAGGTGKDNE